ncbi:RNA polymerase sigma factor [Gabonibacter massiliensis]|uniref:RNA polymerase sigma factor n=1 Tax=Gabonibacter massiliensis TaxID=1720195 RepID=UPI00073E52B5|nr:sigma-70 family RNA polymerase sigma factor [Gabonibacter massiliensis]
MNEDLVLSGVNDKDEKAWASLYDYYYAALCTYVSRILKRPESSEDLVQEVFIAVWKSNRVFISVRELTNYLYRACYNNALIFVRNNQIHDTILDSIGAGKEFTADDVYALTVSEEVTRQLYVHIESLPSEQKRVILLSIEGYSWEEIAEKLGISINTVKTHKGRGIKYLRSKLQDSIYLFLI